MAAAEQTSMSLSCDPGRVARHLTTWHTAGPVKVESQINNKFCVSLCPTKYLGCDDKKKYFLCVWNSVFTGCVLPLILQSYFGFLHDIITWIYAVLRICICEYFSKKMVGFTNEPLSGWILRLRRQLNYSWKVTHTRFPGRVNSAVLRLGTWSEVI